MSITITEVELFRKYFAGNTLSKGKHIYKGQPKKGQKEEGKSFTVKEAVTVQNYQTHLEGTEGLGIVPINNQSKCRFFVIDVDDYSGGVMKLVDKIYSNGFPLIPFQSKSKGLHIYGFLDGFYPADKVVEIAQEFLPVLGLHHNIEIFPKQTKLSTGQVGNWINLPYFSAEKGHQALILADGSLMPFMEFVYTLDSSKHSLESYAEFLSEVQLSDAPPCLQSIFYDKDTKYRNEFLFSMCRYLKSKDGDDFEFSIHKFNNELSRPVPGNELTALINSHKKKDYSYRCNQEPIVSCCNKRLCAKRKYGIGGDDVSELSFEDFIQHQSDPPYYEWIINGMPMKFYTETDIINQAKDLL